MPGGGAAEASGGAHGGTRHAPDQRCIKVHCTHVVLFGLVPLKFFVAVCALG
jgi:hypothetical protein